jgi:hypothetical protein
MALREAQQGVALLLRPGHQLTVLLPIRRQQHRQGSARTALQQQGQAPMGSSRQHGTRSRLLASWCTGAATSSGTQMSCR